MHKTIELNGEWQVSEAGKKACIPAVAPGCDHADLLAASIIPDPFCRDNENAVKWVGTTDWVYTREFQVSASVLLHDRVLLRCEGLDTLATIRVNDHDVGRTDNMFRTWVFDINGMLKAGKNRIEVRFASAANYVAARIAARPKEAPIPQWVQPGSVPGSMFIRKEPCNFGWD